MDGQDENLTPIELDTLTKFKDMVHVWQGLSRSRPPGYAVEQMSDITRDIRSLFNKWSFTESFEIQSNRLKHVKLICNGCNQKVEIFNEDADLSIGSHLLSCEKELKSVGITGYDVCTNNTKPTDVLQSRKLDQTSQQSTLNTNHKNPTQVLQYPKLNQIGQQPTLNANRVGNIAATLVNQPSARNTTGEQIVLTNNRGIEQHKKSNEESIAKKIAESVLNVFPEMEYYNYFCTLCDVKLISRVNLIEHVQGRYHTSFLDDVGNPDQFDQLNLAYHIDQGVKMPYILSKKPST